MPRLNGRVPKYRLHKASGQAVVTLNARDHYLGAFGSESSRVLYDRLVAEWLASGRRPVALVEAVQSRSIDDVILAFWQYAKGYYVRADGTPTSELDNYRQALRPLRRLYGQTPAADFNALALKAVREKMIDHGWCRRNINNHMHRLSSVFKWAASEQLVSESVYHQLKTIIPLKRNRSRARESKRIPPVPEELIIPLKPFVSQEVWALIQLQLLTGARAGELVILRAMDIQTGGPIWRYCPDQHKTAHHGHERRINFGPQAQATLGPFLVDRPVDACLFNPAEAERRRRQELHARRKTPLSCGNRPGTHRTPTPRRAPTACYTVGSYCRAIHRACQQAFPPPPDLACRRVEGAKGTRWETRRQWRQRLGEEKWKLLRDWEISHRWSPHRLRKNAATRIRKQFGVESSKVILGHSSIAVNELYAERDQAAAAEIMLRIG